MKPPMFFYGKTTGRSPGGHAAILKDFQFFSHGCPGSRLEIIFLDAQARKYGLKIIVFERPGFGRSDFIDG